MLKLGIGHPCYGQLTAIKKGYPRAPLWPWLNLCIIYSNIKSVLLNQDVSKRVDELFPIISFVSCRNSTSYGTIRLPFHAESDSGIAAATVVLVVSKDTDSCFGRITFSAANSIKPFSITVALQGALRTNQRLPGMTAQAGCTEGSVGDEGVKRGGSLILKNKPNLISDPHSETDLGKTCTPVGW